MPPLGPNEGAGYQRYLVRQARKLMQRYGDAEKPLWITEMGTGTNVGITPEQQAKLLTDSFTALQETPGISGIFWFCLQDTKMDIVGPESSMGMITQKLERKPAFAAFTGATPGE